MTISLVYGAETGNVRFWGPDGHEAFVDGKKVGVTKSKPEWFVAKDIPAGKRRVKVQRPGFEATEKTIELKARDTYIFKFDEKNYVIEDVTLELLAVKAGTYMRGSPPDEKYRPEKVYRETQHEVTLTKPFWLGKTEVSQAQYKAITGHNPSKFKGDNLPVETVTWLDAYKFCLKLTEREKKAGRLPKGMVYRLPTSAEWEYAARSGNPGPYPFEGTSALRLMEYAWYSRVHFLRHGYKESEDTLDSTHPVGTKKPNAWGFHNMFGNVSELCYDFCLQHTKEPKVDPTWPEPGLEKQYFSSARFMVKGGSFKSNQRECRVASYSLIMFGSKWEATGFRLALGFPLRPHLIPEELLKDKPVVENDDDEK